MGTRKRFIKAVAAFKLVNKEDLEELYLRQCKTLQEIASIYGVTRKQVTIRFHRIGIAVRNMRESKVSIRTRWSMDSNLVAFQSLSKSEMETLYGKTGLHKIARTYQIPIHYVRRRLKDFGIKLRTSSEVGKLMRSNYSPENERKSRINFSKYRKALALSLHNRTDRLQMLLYYSLKRIMSDSNLDFEHPVYDYRFYIDIVCFDTMRGIEVDARWHKKTVEQDRMRQERIEKEGWTLLRLGHKELILDFESTLDRCVKFLQAESCTSTQHLLPFTWCG